MTSIPPCASARPEEAVHDLLDVPAELLDRARREGLAHQPAQPGVIGRVTEEHRAGQPIGLLPAVHRGEHLLELLAPEPRVAQDGHAVLVAREDPETHRRLVDGLLLAQPPVERVRIGVEFRQERVEQDFRGGHQRASASHSTSAGCFARRPARCWICWRQEMPGATTSVLAGVAFTAGASRRLPRETDTS